MQQQNHLTTTIVASRSRRMTMLSNSNYMRKMVFLTHNGMAQCAIVVIESGLSLRISDFAIKMSDFLAPT